MAGPAGRFHARPATNYGICTTCLERRMAALRVAPAALASSGGR